MSNILDEIVAYKKQFVEEAKQRMPPEQLQELAERAARPRNFFKAVTQKSDTINVIAEVKRASPSAGVIREDFDPIEIAKMYEEAGAAAISCLTDEKYFRGKLSYIDQIKTVVKLPVLRKDFMIDPYQLYESRVYGADAILLIAECLTESELIDMLILATQLQLTALVEVHSMDNLLRVRPHIGFPHAGYCLLGINNRDLTAMTTDLNHTLRLIDLVDDRKILVSESGIRTHEDVVKLQGAGVRSVLVGEHLMKQENPAVALRELIHGNGEVE